MSDDFTLMPYARPGLMTTTQPPVAGGSRLSVNFSADVLGDGAVEGAAITLSAQMHGPGDVIGFDQSAILTTDPDGSAGSFEANYFPYVEFHDVDFPWRYSLDNTTTRARLMPWLTAIALKGDEYEVLETADAPLPAIRVLQAAQSLPKANDIHFAAHVHLAAAPSGASALEDALNDDPAAGTARILCMRKLEESQSYTLFLIPTYELGRMAGLGQAPQATPYDKMAWAARTGAIDLPIYFSHRFHTNSGEDVEAMLRRLRAIDASESEDIGKQDKIFAGKPGYYADYNKANKHFMRQTATNDPGAADPGFATDSVLARKIDLTLTEAINSAEVDESRADADAGNPVEDPLVTFPAYGWRYREERGLNSRRPSKYWFDRLNLDLQYRDAASAGAEVVRKHQDRYMRLSWAQYEGIVQANEKLARLQAAERLARTLTKNRLDKLDAATTLTLAEPVWPIVAGGDSTILASIEANGAPSSYASRAMRRLASKRARTPKIERERSGARQIPVPSLPGDSDATGFRAVDRDDRVVAARAQAAAPVSRALNKQLKGLMGADYLGAIKPFSGVIAVAKTSSKRLAEPIPALMLALPKAKADITISGRTPPEKRKITPVFRGPVIADALAERLREQGIARLFPGIDKLPDNTVTFMEENRAFIEAFMVGANHEMNRELRWRGFPTDMRATVFQRFWQRGYSLGDPRGNDIDPIHGWTGALGDNVPVSDADQAENLVMIIKGDIIRKIGLPIIELNLADGDEWVEGQGTTYEPIFFGRAGDAAYFGFDISRDTIVAPANADRAFLVIYEPPGRMRFGLDVGTQDRRVNIRANAAIRRPFPVRTLGKGRSFAREPVLRIPPPPPNPQPATWDDISWSHIRTESSDYLDFTSAPRPTQGADHWGNAKNAASIARSLWQKPIAAILPLKRVL